jgi:membrane-bound ClpP family serine protease
MKTVNWIEWLFIILPILAFLTIWGTAAAPWQAGYWEATIAGIVIFVVGIVILCYPSKSVNSFLKPDWRKIVLVVILYAIAFLFVLSLNVYTLPILIARGLLALLGWYVVSCLIVWAYDKLRKKPEKKKRR